MLSLLLGALGLARVDPDLRLVHRALRGHGGAVRQLVERLMPVIRAQIGYTLARQPGRRTQGDRDDYAQEVWVALWADDGRRLKAYDRTRGASFEGYVGLIAERELLGLLRKESAQKRGGDLRQVNPELLGNAVDGGASPERAAMARDEAQALLSHLKTRLPERGMLVFRCLYTDGRGVAETAEMLGVSAQVVYNWQHKIRKAARAFAEQEG